MQTDYNEILKRMEAREGLRAYYDYCVAYRSGGAIDINALLAWLDAWAAAHPVKTYAMDCKERIPTSDPYSMCVMHVYGRETRPDFCHATEKFKGCKDCWNRPMPEETK